MTRRNPNAEGESPGSTFGAWIVLACIGGYLALACLVINELIPGGTR